MSISKLLNHRRYALPGLFSLLLVLMSACASPPGKTSNPSTTRPPLSTQRPTATQIQIPAATKTPIPTATATDTPVPWVAPEERDLIAAVQASADQRSIWKYDSAVSPWSLEVVRYECVKVEFNEMDQLAYEELRVIEPNGAVTVVAQQLQYCGGLGAYGLNGLFFSPDGKSFYYNEARAGTPDGLTCGYWFKGTSRVNLETLETVRLPGEGPLSPDGEQMLLWSWTDFVLWDLNAGEIGRMTNPFENRYALSIEFNEDGTQAAAVLTEDCIRPEAASAVVLLNIAEMTPETLLQASDPGYVGATWSSNDTLVLEDFNGLTYTFRLPTGELTPVDSPTPNPD